MHCQSFQSDSLECRRFKAQLDAALDARQPSDHSADLRAHAQRCPACAQWLDQHQALLAALTPRSPNSAQARLLPGADFGLRVLQSVLLQQREQQRRRRRQLSALALAATLLLAVVGWRFSGFDSHFSNLPQHTLASAQPPLAEWAGLAGDLGASRRVLVEGFAQGLKPVTSSVNTALNILLRTLPGNESPQHML